MPNRIQLLPEQVANQIAAGEVIERPASVLKELVENALDAGASQIDIVTRGGGRSLIQVTDNGHGMSRDDALLCLERHATSKIRRSEDLDHLASYGFRGEALPSIASVSKFRLRTREPGDIAGTELIINGGKLVSVQEAGLAPGTQVEVRSLFFNLPARRKFLRTEQTESAHLQHHLLLAALSRPDVGFTITHQDHAPVRWSPGQDLYRRLGSIYSPELLRQLVPVQGEQDDLKISGFIGQPGISRGNRQEELLFVNHRPVDNRTLHYGLLEGYHNALMKSRYPVAFLFLEMDPAGVDVNIHPAKREVRFHEDARLRQFVVRAVHQALQDFQSAPVAVSLTPPPSTINRSALTPSPETTGTSFTPPTTPVPVITTAATLPPPLHSPSLFPAPASADSAPPARATQDSSPKNPLGFRLLGIVANLYLVAESPDGLVLIDQHAAHERILFEQMLARLAREEVKSQGLLLPVTVEFPPREADFLAVQLEALNKIGLGLSQFGPHTFLLDAVPPMVKARDLQDFLRTLLVELGEAGGETRKTRRLSEEVVAKTVCRHAVKANDRLKPEEAEHLIRDLLACDLPYTCPHGRPTMILFSAAELEKKFGRT